MKRSRLNPIGKKGRANKTARDKIAVISQQEGYEYCVLGEFLTEYPDKCIINASDPVHRHKRDYYNGDDEKLADPKQWIPGCRRCHKIVEDDKDLTEIIFLELRGEE